MRFHVTSLCWIVGCTVALTTPVAAQSFLVQEGEPRAEIVVAEKSPRTTRLAAQELQTYVQKISGAKLRIVTEPSENVQARVFVGKSPFTDRLGVTDDGLIHGAYRIVSGKDWLVLMGDDRDFVPIEPWPRSHNDIASGKMQKAWNAITGEHWGYPHSQLRKHYTGATGLFGTKNEQHVDSEGRVNVWGFDERGSFNAVCGYLRSLGVRWYMPGEIGEVVPRLDTLPLSKIDQTVRPDFPLRTVNFRFGVHGRDVAMWAMRLGLRQPYGRQAAHGLHHMTHNDFTRQHHPNWFALYGGKRQTQPDRKVNQLCYSNEELFRASVRYVRAQLDHFDMDVVSVMPPDGYTAICQCDKCQGQDTPQRGYRGALSDYVWEFVNRVAKEVGKTHPDKMISCCAYGSYTLPPEKIDKLEPNVQVIIVGGRRPTSLDREEIRQLREAWTAKTDRPLEIFENYPFTGRGFYLPAFTAQVIGKSINATKGQSRGEDIWLTMDFGDDAVGLNHFLIYFTARMYWGGQQQSVNRLFDEYCKLFFGPAEDEMREFFQFCETHWQDMEKEEAVANQALQLFARAKNRVHRVGSERSHADAKAESAGRDSSPPYAQRIQLIDHYLQGLRNRRVQLAQKRGPVPKLRLVSGSRGQVVVDGKLDDQPWRECPAASTARMSELQTGRQPVFGTSIKTAWIGNSLYFAIRCDDHPGASLNVTATKRDDQAIWYGDVVEFLLETDSHSYYQIAVNPDGAVVDLDRGADKRGRLRWDSQAEVATHIADDHWTIEIRIPVIQDANDPWHQVIGRKPTQSLPWHINVCRQRIRDNGAEYSALAPTGTASFHVPLKFAHFYAGKSHNFRSDPTVTDFLIARIAADQWSRRREFGKALAAFLSLAKDDNATDLQRSDALEQAARCARAAKDFGQAANIANQIPLAAVANTVRMENLLAERQLDAIVAQFGDEDFNRWPFWQVGAAAQVRGRAFAMMKSGERADADFQTALRFTSDGRSRTSILAAMGDNRETNLSDDEGALKAYRQNFLDRKSIGAADEFRSVLGAARILTRQRKFDEAIATLKLAQIDQRSGYWRHALELSLGNTLAAAGRGEQASRAYRNLLKDPSASSGLRQQANERLEAIQTKR